MRICGGIADVIALHKTKEHVIEFEFKKTSHDLKVLERRKAKNVKLPDHYQSPFYKKPHKFYFVVPEKLWEKEQEYLKRRKCGVIVYYPNKGGKKRNFLTMIPSKINQENVQSYDAVLGAFLSRCSSAYARLITTHYKKGKRWY